MMKSFEPQYEDDVTSIRYLSTTTALKGTFENVDHFERLIVG